MICVYCHKEIGEGINEGYQSLYFGHGEEAVIHFRCREAYEQLKAPAPAPEPEFVRTPPGKIYGVSLTELKKCAEKLLDAISSAQNLLNKPAPKTFRDELKEWISGQEASALTSAGIALAKDSTSSRCFAARAAAFYEIKEWLDLHTKFWTESDDLAVFKVKLRAKLDGYVMSPGSIGQLRGWIDEH